LTLEKGTRWNGIQLEHGKDLSKSIAELSLGIAELYLESQEYFQSYGIAVCQDVIYLFGIFQIKSRDRDNIWCRDTGRGNEL